jgi:hypothetical protein
MNEVNQKLLGDTPWNIADQQRESMDVADIRDYKVYFPSKYQFALSDVLEQDSLSAAGKEQ